MMTPYQPQFGNPMMNPSMQLVNKMALAPALYVGDLDENIQEESLYDFFSKYGQIHFVRIMRDSATGKSRGYAFVNFIHPRDGKKSLCELFYFIQVKVKTLCNTLSFSFSRTS